MGLNTETVGALERSGDVDYFQVDVTEAGRLTVETIGTTDTFGYFGRAEGRWLALDDKTGMETNFSIVQDVAPGMHYVAVVGANGRQVAGAYTQAVYFAESDGSADDHGDTRRQATRVELNTATLGMLERAGDVDYFRVEVAQAGQIRMATSGTTDTAGYLEASEGRSAEPKRRQRNQHQLSTRAAGHCGDGLRSGRRGKEPYSDRGVHPAREFYGGRFCPDRPGYSIRAFDWEAD